MAGGPGNDTIFARDGERDAIACGGGSDTATVDALDQVAGLRAHRVAGCRLELPRAVRHRERRYAGRIIRGTPRNDILSAVRGTTASTARAGTTASSETVATTLLVGGPGQDVVEAGAGSDTVSAADGARDRIDCGAGRDSATSDRQLDTLAGCEIELADLATTSAVSSTSVSAPSLASASFTSAAADAATAVELGHPGRPAVRVQRPGQPGAREGDDQRPRLGSRRA